MVLFAARETTEYEVHLRKIAKLVVWNPSEGYTTENRLGIVSLESLQQSGYWYPGAQMTLTKSHSQDERRVEPFRDFPDTYLPKSVSNDEKIVDRQCQVVPQG
jgi:hypothetical protein